MSKIVIMTGCSSGIGLATAKRLAHDPDQRFVIIATVIAMSEKEDLVAAVGDKLDKTVFIKKLDITNDEDIASVVDDIIQTHSRIDVLINIAGTGVYGLVERISRQQIEHVFNVNTIGTIRLTQAVLPGMKKRRAGKIVTVTSLGGKLGVSGADIYCASKFALEGFFESLAASARSFNIRVCVVAPGGVQTALVDTTIHGYEAQAADESLDDIDRHQFAYLSTVMKEGNLLTPDDVADAILTRCLDVDEPVFRHLVGDDLKVGIEEAVKDLTGEASIALGRKMIGAS